jgi:uncharacterized tellurite resistance protein B-like protein
MIDGIKDFFNQFIATDNAASDAARQHALEIATAALLLEMMRMDSTVTDEETATVTSVLQARFGLTAKELDTLLRFATEEARQATDYFQFTSLINRYFSAANRKSRSSNTSGRSPSPTATSTPTKIISCARSATCSTSRTPTTSPPSSGRGKGAELP